MDGQPHTDSFNRWLPLIIYLTMHELHTVSGMYWRVFFVVELYCKWTLMFKFNLENMGLIILSKIVYKVRTIN